MFRNVERIDTSLMQFFFFFNDTATTEIYTLSLHDALPICHAGRANPSIVERDARPSIPCGRSEEHTSELQSPCKLVCRLLLEKKNNNHSASLRQRNIKYLFTQHTTHLT